LRISLAALSRIWSTLRRRSSWRIPRRGTSPPTMTPSLNGLPCTSNSRTTNLLFAVLTWTSEVFSSWRFRATRRDVSETRETIAATLSFVVEWVSRAATISPRSFVTTHVRRLSPSSLCRFRSIRSSRLLFPSTIVNYLMSWFHCGASRPTPRWSHESRCPAFRART